jgi:ATP-binding cassette subfamily C protein CydCD
VLPVAALVTVFTLVVGGGAAYLVSRAGVRHAESSLVAARGRLGAAAVQTLQGAPELLMWQAADRALDRVDAASTAVGNAQARSARMVALGRTLALLSAGAGVVVTAWLGAPALAAGDVSGPMLALLVLLPLALLDVTSPLADAGALSVRCAEANRRLADLAGTPPAVSDPDDPVPSDPSDTTVRVERVRAGWGDAPVLRDLSLVLAPGARLGVVGPSGCGKSTLAAVLMRFLDPQSGRVRLGSTPMERLRLADVRRTVGLVDDDPHLFASNLRENLRLADPEASDETLWSALRAVRLGDWAAALPDGLDTLLGDGHSQVSGGERARIGLARAALADQPVLVLDEPTAHLDTPTARAVTEDLLAAGADRTVLWITHGDIGLDRMDRVLDLGSVTVAESAVLPAGVR